MMIFAVLFNVNHLGQWQLEWCISLMLQLLHSGFFAKADAVQEGVCPQIFIPKQWKMTVHFKFPVWTNSHQCHRWGTVATHHERIDSQHTVVNHDDKQKLQED